MAAEWSIMSFTGLYEFLTRNSGMADALATIIVIVL